MTGIGLLSLLAAASNAVGLAIGTGLYVRTARALPVKALQAANINLLVNVIIAAANGVQAMPVACADELFPRIADSVAGVMYAAVLNLAARVWLRIASKE